MSLKAGLEAFVAQSKRVIAITHKPGRAEYKQMALTTAIGMIIIGLLGFAIGPLAFTGGPPYSAASARSTSRPGYS